MSDDLLQRAASALRETSQAPNPRAGLTRARLLASAERRHAPRRVLALRWLLISASLLVGGTAMAAQLAGGLPELWHAIAPNLAPAPSRPSHRARPHSAGPTAPRGPAPIPLEPSAPGPLEPIAPADVLRPAVSAPDAPRPPPRPRVKRVPRTTPAADASALQPAAAVPAPQPATGAPESAELALFRRAERLHRAHEPAALAAWDAYLRVAGNGPLAPEARYNRALCLVRLGRAADASAALQPFARGELHGYRQTEARALLESLGR